MQLTIELPDTLPDFLQKSREEFETEAKMALAVKLFEMKRVPSGIAASMVGMPRTVFLLNLHKYGVPMIDLSEEELMSDLENV